MDVKCLSKPTECGRRSIRLDASFIEISNPIKENNVFLKPLKFFSSRISYRWRVAIICSTIKNDSNYACFDLLWLLHIFNVTHTFANCFLLFCIAHFNLQSAVRYVQCAMLIVIPLPIQTFKLSLAQIHIYESRYCNIIANDIIYWQFFFTQCKFFSFAAKWKRNRQKMSLFKWNAINVYVHIMYNVFAC